MPRLRVSRETADALEMAEDTVIESFINRVYYLAREGMAMYLYLLLMTQTEEQINTLINQKIMQQDGEECTLLTIAARHGHFKVVTMLIDKFKPDLEQEGTVKFDGYVIDGASALWCAAGAGYLDIVKTLVKAGADVNHATDTNSTPLRAACFDGRLDIVTYLTEHRANIHIANKYNNTCLMIAAYKGHEDVVSYLLDQGLSPDDKANCGATALHFAAECGHSNIIVELLKRGASITKNDSNMTPIITAAERSRAEVVEAFVQQNVVTKEETIDAYELLGASYANDKDSYCLVRAYKYLHRAMELRYSDPENVMRKNLGEPVKAYEYWRECETLDQLEAIKNNQNALHMEGLAIRERILGPRNAEVPHPLIFRGAIFADNARFDRCIDLWLHALKLRQSNNISVVKDLLRFAQVFSQMIHVGVDLQFQQVLDVLEANVIELCRNKAKLEESNPEDINQCINESESNIITTLYILTILTKLMTINGYGKNCDEPEVKRAHYLVHKLCALRCTFTNGRTLLHLAVNAKTPVDDFHTNDVCKFPCAATVKLLIQCGADVNAMDNDRNTPLHLIVTYQKPISGFMTLHCIILELIDAGAHIDTVNSLGKTPYEAAATGVAEIILRTRTKISLKCMAAKAVKTYGLSYNGHVPRTLESFIELHGSGLNQG
ncbi:protein fem-1 homolog B isoform X2 [Venturia canescens]|uniref:protein fem-1 homolog B isoform X2 n=1 Tax=Venturia canescens TaxID=32260 RepID=UPI001C9D1CAB|nr:protein fem-1 homolog B isoform X2 [Venturia canescens]